MPITDANDPASHCLGLIQPMHAPFSYGQGPFPVNHTGIGSASNGGLASGPPKEELPYKRALDFLFSDAKQNLAATRLCQEIELRMEPPVEAGVVQYLFRLQAIGRISDWPLLFGAGNSFVLYLLEKMTMDDFPADSENERMIWELRRKEAAEWAKQRQ
ncbi:hypothetical protein BGZ70_003481 [Mortierella alpina]|uniref:Uncharacterized protein n=1 Tax=Mortierella alpina TaxID=64518 RepID=A0A9P6JB08_MORAP|nr:hypothetical protein BGZ70_003481 [Mortierella alpina]